MKYERKHHVRSAKLWTHPSTEYKTIKKRCFQSLLYHVFYTRFAENSLPEIILNVTTCARLWEKNVIEGSFSHEKVKLTLQLYKAAKWPIKNADCCLGLYSTVAHGRMLNEVVMVIVMPSKKLPIPNEQGVHINPHKARLCYGLLKQGSNMKGCISTQE